LKKMHLTTIAVASLLLTACTHDYDVFKPRPDAGADASAKASALDTGDTNEPLEDAEEN